ncbi:uncharacterized protein LOC132751431 [Ruditapes philippinarum]|uniref:uncharacterized protein LOC132751431 n=1 Tax=Ruditapes philippinarum TaxID=129788 RepID=UPI00295A5A1E|nr:uncharacterized protein LOC132751431 [Ruditapes philippinarum]
METSLIIRSYMIVFSIAALVLQTIGLTGNMWFGFSLTMNKNGINVTGKMHGGLLEFTPLEICDGSETTCKTPDQFPENQRRTFDEMDRKFSDILKVLRSLVITGIATSSCGMVMLFLYLFTSKRPKTLLCTGTASAIAWMFAALPVFTAIGVQLYLNMNIKRSSKFLTTTGTSEVEDQLHISFITPWDLIIIGVGGGLAFIVGILVFLTTVDKSRNTPKVRFRKISRDTDEIRIVENEEEFTDEEEEF